MPTNDDAAICITQQRQALFYARRQRYCKLNAAFIVVKMSLCTLTTLKKLTGPRRPPLLREDGGTYSNERPTVFGPWTCTPVYKATPSLCGMIRYMTLHWKEYTAEDSNL